MKNILNLLSFQSPHKWEEALLQAIAPDLVGVDNLAKGPKSRIQLHLSLIPSLQLQKQCSLTIGSANFSDRYSMHDIAYYSTITTNGRLGKKLTIYLSVLEQGVGSKYILLEALRQTTENH